MSQHVLKEQKARLTVSIRRYLPLGGVLNVLAWWYRSTAPATSNTQASPRRLEILHQGQLISLTLLVTTILICAGMLIALLTRNNLVCGIFLGDLLATGAACRLNQREPITLAGIVVIITMTCGFLIAEVVSPIKHLSDLLWLDFLVVPDFLAISLLPTRWVFPVASLNCCSIIIAFCRVVDRPSNPFISLGAVGWLVATQLLIAGVFYAWVHSGRQAIVRADLARVVVALQKVRDDQDHSRQQAKLTQSSDHLAVTIRRVAAGDIQARACLPEEDVLTPAAGALNLLLERLARQSALADELEHTKQQAGRVMAALREATQIGEPSDLPPGGTGTFVDLIIQALQDYIQASRLSDDL